MNSFTQQIEKVVVNAGIGRFSSQAGFSDKMLPEFMRDFALITGQKPRTAPARKSISGFKLREGTIVGLAATLRGKRMTAFLDRVIKVALPRIRDFRGIRLSAVDKNGNLSLGIREITTFPEVNPEVTRASFGVQLTVVPKKSLPRESAIALYRSLGIPLQKS